ncbi:unnamed protein product [Protopolystoma xenopodis]|uniref:Uncharacterized protein n=1 Tax=Protopolystoma xenopodis TaxID=117903 RepID=A0A3S5AP99_9PLAT|nr:unnamed protein product [Protopolystoma xenopodis]
MTGQSAAPSLPGLLASRKCSHFERAATGPDSSPGNAATTRIGHDGRLEQSSCLADRFSTERPAKLVNKNRLTKQREWPALLMLMLLLISMLMPICINLNLP